MRWGLGVGDQWFSYLIFLPACFGFFFGGEIKSANNLAGFQWVDWSLLGFDSYVAYTADDIIAGFLAILHS